MHSVSSVLHPAQIESIPVASASLDPRDMVSALARLRQHGVVLECEVDTVAAPEWDRIAGEFDDLNDDQITCDTVSYLLLRHHGKPVAGARVAVIKLPGFRRGLALLHFGPVWRRRGEQIDFTMYRAALGALVQEYCLRRGHCLTIIPCTNPEFYAWETQALADFGFTVRRSGEYDYCSQPSARIIGNAIYALRSLQRTIRRWRYGT
jgi:hypothetical protein